MTQTTTAPIASRNPFAVRDFRLLWIGEAGRVMSVMITGSVGLVPVSMLVAGLLVEIRLDGMLVGAGVGMAVVAFVSLLFPTVRRIGFVPPYQGPDEGEAGASAAGPTAEPARA